MKKAFTTLITCIWSAVDEGQNLKFNVIIMNIKIMYKFTKNVNCSTQKKNSKLNNGTMLSTLPVSNLVEYEYRK